MSNINELFSDNYLQKEYDEDLRGEYGEIEEIMAVRRPPVGKQMNKNMANNKFYDNLVEVDPQTSRATPSPDISLNEYLAIYKKLMMTEKSGREFSSKVSQIIPEVIFKKSNLLKEAQQEFGILGNYYVDSAPFKTCEEAKIFFDKHCKLAMFLTAKPECAGCVKRVNNKCSLIGKYVVNTIPYNPNLIKAYGYNLYKYGQISMEDLKSILSKKDCNVKEKTKLLFKNKSSSEVKTGLELNVKVSEAPRKSAISTEDIEKLLTGLIKRGVKYDTLREKIGVRIGNRDFVTNIRKAVRKLDSIDIAKFSNCDESLEGLVRAVEPNQKCCGCKYNTEGIECGKFKVAFTTPIEKDYIQETKTLNEKHKATIVATPSSDPNISSYKVKELVEVLVKKGMPYDVMKDKLSAKVGSKMFEDALLKALATVGTVDAVKFCKCDPKFKGYIGIIKQNELCKTCTKNTGGISCKTYNAKFINGKYADTYMENVVGNLGKAVKGDFEFSGEQSVVKYISDVLAGKNNKYKTFDDLKTLTSFVPAETFKKAYKTAQKQVKNIDAYKFCGCDKDAIPEAEIILRGVNCNGCYFDKGDSCSKLGLSYINPVELENKEAEVDELISASFSNPTEVKTQEIKNPDDESIAIIHKLLDKECSIDAVKAVLLAKGYMSNQSKSIITRALKSYKKAINLTTFNNCDKSYCKDIKTIKKTKQCKNCISYHSVKCNKVNLGFK